MNQVCGSTTGTASSGPARCGKPATGRRIEPVGPPTDDHLVCGIHARSARARGVQVEPLPGPDVRVGQIWRDADPRGDGRRIRIVEVVTDPEPINGHAKAHPYVVVEQVVTRQRDPGRPGRRTRIRLDRFRPGSTGYVLDTDAPNQE